MFTKFVHVRIDPEKLGQLGDLIRRELVPCALAQDGARQVCWLADASRSRLLGITHGEGSAPSAPAETQMGRVRTALLEQLGASLIGIETFPTPADGCDLAVLSPDHRYVRVAWFEGVRRQPPFPGDGVRAALGPPADDACAVRWFCDDRTGNALALLAWNDPDRGWANRVPERRFRRRARRSLGCHMSGARDYRTVCSALRAGREQAAPKEALA